jgi:hypothetical protein
LAHFERGEPGKVRIPDQKRSDGMRLSELVVARDGKISAKLDYRRRGIKKCLLVGDEVLVSRQAFLLLASNDDIMVGSLMSCMEVIERKGK